MKLRLKYRSFLTSLLFLAVLVSSLTAGAGIPAPPLPPLIVPVPPAMVLIPGTNIYFPPDVAGELFFYHGQWYRLYEGRWYLARHYNGPWRFVSPRNVPHAVRSVPPGYRRVAPGHQRIPYGQLKSNWRTWERGQRSDREKHRDGPKKQEKHNGKKRKKEQRSEQGAEKERMREHGR